MLRQTLTSKKTGAGHVQLNDNSIIQGENIIFKTPLLRNNYFIVDSIVYDCLEVKYCQIDTDYYANVSSLLKYTKRNNVFGIRLVSGKINCFASVTSNYFYNKLTDGRYSDLKNGTDENLRTDFGDNPKSMLYIENSIKNDKIYRIVYWSGYVLLGGTLVGLITKIKGIEFFFGFLFIVSCFIPTLFKQRANKYLVKATEIYNTQ